MPVFRLVDSIVVSRPVAVCINIGSLPLDVRLAILSIRKSAATNLARLAYCIPAILDAAPIGFRFIDVPCSQVCHDDRSSVPAAAESAAYGPFVPLVSNLSSPPFGSSRDDGRWYFHRRKDREKGAVDAGGLTFFVSELLENAEGCDPGRDSNHGQNRT